MYNNTLNQAVLILIQKKNSAFPNTITKIFFNVIQSMKQVAWGMKDKRFNHFFSHNNEQVRMLFCANI